ncbi:MAG: [FeFe] hydrogenase H-cluster radical SAM maturase HydE [Bacillota bacterium]
MALNRVKGILKKAKKEHTLTGEEIAVLLKTKREEKELLYKCADQVRADYVGDEVYLRGIIEFSNYCQQDCFYCGLRSGNRELDRYRLEPEQIIEMAGNACRLGYKTIVLQSGEDDYYDTEMITEIIKKIKKKYDTALTLCVGERDYEEYRIWREAGADRYLLRHETADPGLYEKLHPGRSLDSRIKRLKWLKELDYQVGSGNLIGLPGQDISSLVRDLQLFKELDLEMVGLGPFIPHPHTPLDDARQGSLELSLKCIALTRLLLPYCLIPGTTALGSIDPRGRQKALQCGANVVMPNVTVGDYRPLYELYPAKICIEEEPDNCRECIGSIINSLGREVGTGYGHSPKGEVI